MLDARQGSINALNSNADFVNWQGELDSTAPQWGIMNGKSAGNLAGAWMAPSGQKNVDLSSLGRSVRALLYRVQWDTGFTAQLFMVCNTPENAAGFATLIGLLQQAGKQSTPASATALPPILQSIETHRDGARLELDVSGPPELLDQILAPGRELRTGRKSKSKGKTQKSKGKSDKRHAHQHSCQEDKNLVLNCRVCPFRLVPLRFKSANPCFFGEC